MTGKSKIGQLAGRVRKLGISEDGEMSDDLLETYLIDRERKWMDIKKDMELNDDFMDGVKMLLDSYPPYCIREALSLSIRKLGMNPNRTIAYSVGILRNWESAAKNFSEEI